MSNIDLETIIEDAVTDSQSPEPVEPIAETPVDTAPEPEPIIDEPVVEATTEVTNPATQPTAEQDEFAKRYGLQSQSIGGRENRIPYSRVKKIVARAEQEAIARVKKESDGTFQPKITEYETKVKDYEDRLTKVAQFEHVLENDPKTFLNMLSQVPAYKEFFDYLGQVATQQTQPVVVPPGDPMPQPNQPQADGTRIYDEDGLKALMDWQARQVEGRVTKQVTEQIDQRYEPIRKEWETNQQMAKVVPIIQRQIEEARTWPQFSDHEADIVAALKADKQLSLDGAYRKVVYPRLQTSRDDMRKSILEELKKKPIATSAPMVATKPQPMADNRPRSLEDIITEAANSLK